MLALAIVKYFVLFLTVSFLLVITIDILGRLFSSSIQAAQSNSYFTSSSQLFHFIQQPEHYPKWRYGLSDISKDPSSDTWQEWFGRKEKLSMQGIQHTKNMQVYQIHSHQQTPFSFNRTYTIYRKDKLSFLHIEDELNFTNPFLILFATFFYDHSKIIKQELKNLDDLLS